MITVDGATVRVETRTQTAVFDNGLLTSLRSKPEGREHIGLAERPPSALQLFYPGIGCIDVVGGLASTIEVVPMSPTRAEYRFHGWDADGILSISDDEETGDVVVEPSAFSSRSGVLSCRWLLPGISPDLDLVAPFFQGVRLPLNDPLLERRWFWPQFWEAGLAIFCGAEGGFWVHAQDTAYRYKALDIAGGVPALETEAYGPISLSRGAGGLAWRLNVFDGEWKVPASAYRDWLFRAFSLGDVRRSRIPWTHDIRFALCWYDGNPVMLDALARKLDPATVLIHYSDWRTDGYDENYPTYEPSAEAAAVFAKAHAMGFHVMPHCNSVDMDPTNPVYALVRDFQYREVQSRGLLGWGYDPESGRVLGVPNSNRALSENRRRKVMIKVHPGHSMWRSVLAERIGGAVRAVGTDAVFIDVTLCSHNLDNCLVENTTSTEGMHRLIERVSSLHGGLAVGGEGLNEITMQGLSFAQAHLFASWQDNCEGLERVGGCALNELLFGSLCRTIGYSGLGGRDRAQELRMRVHEEHGAIPTVTVRDPDEILHPNRAVQRALERATS